MDWVSDHLQLIIAIAGAVAWWLNQQKHAKDKAEGAAPEQTFQDPDLAERTRRIRDEIQRKIEQRAREQEAGRPPAGPVAADGMERLLEAERARARAASARLEAMHAAEELQRQQALETELRAAEEWKMDAMRRTQAAAGTEPPVAVRPGLRRAVNEGLRSPAALRRAFVLREVLGPPVALR